MIDPLLLFVWCWIASPIFPLVATWAQLFSVKKSGATIGAEPAALLLVATMSYSWILTGIVLPSAMGPHYSSRRFTVIWINLGIMACLAVWSFIRGQRLRWLLLVSCALTASAWLYIALVSSIV